MADQIERRMLVNAVDRWLRTSGSPTSPNYPELGVVEQWTQYQKPSAYTTASAARVYSELIALLMPRLETQVSKQILTDIAELKQAVQETKEYVISKPQVYSLLLSDLGDSNVEVLSPISIVLEETEEECLASSCRKSQL